MPRVIASGRFKDKDIQMINYCQIYLNVATIADITLACGKKLDPHMYKGGKTLFSSVATHMKTHQQKPGSASWGVWCKAMALWARECNLKVPLKKWHFPASRLSRHWPTYYDYATDN
eukprot:14085172-Ditylum_brightwellii.AAC.1